MVIDFKTIASVWRLKGKPFVLAFSGDAYLRPVNVLPKFLVLFRASAGGAKVKDMAAKTNRDVQDWRLFLNASWCNGLQWHERGQRKGNNGAAFLQIPVGNLSLRHFSRNRSVRLGVRTPDFHSGNTGSIPVQTTGVKN